MKWIMKWLTIVPWLCCIASEDPRQACHAGDESCDDEYGSDQSSLLMLRKGLNAKVTAGSRVVKAVPTGAEPRCAVCFLGELRNLNETRDLLKRNLLDAIASEGVKVDVFVASPKKGPFGIVDFQLVHGTETNTVLASKVGTIGFFNDDPLNRVAIRDFRMATEPTVAEFQKLLSVAPKKALDLYAQKKFLLGPLYGEDRNEIRIYNHEAECLEMMQAAEKQHDIQYKWVMKTRPDFHWLTPHPPLSLTRPDMLWTFDTETYFAVNDRHVVGGRDVMFDGMLNKMKVLETGDPVIYNPAKSKDGGLLKGLSDEWFSKLLADGRNIHVAHMPTLAFLSPCPAWSTHCTRNGNASMMNGLYYNDEVKHAKSNQAQWVSKACFKLTAYDKIGIAQNCPPA